ncbi:MAG: hypothetical protein V4493_09675 [Pseudomonadota bacterium]
MTPNDFYYSHSKEVIKKVAAAADTSFGNFKQIAIANGNVSKALAERLAVASQNVMTELEILYPERYQKSVDREGVPEKAA